MTKSTEWLLRISAIIFILWFGYSLVERSIITIIQQQGQIRQLAEEIQRLKK